MPIAYGPSEPEPEPTHPTPPPLTSPPLTHARAYGPACSPAHARSHVHHQVSPNTVATRIELGWRAPEDYCLEAVVYCLGEDGLLTPEGMLNSQNPCDSSMSINMNQVAHSDATVSIEVMLPSIPYKVWALCLLLRLRRRRLRGVQIQPSSTPNQGCASGGGGRPGRFESACARGYQRLAKRLGRNLGRVPTMPHPVKLPGTMVKTPTAHHRGKLVENSSLALVAVPDPLTTSLAYGEFA